MSLVLKLKDQYNSHGYFKIEHFFEKKFINNILKEIEILKSEKSKEIQIYKDGNGHVHRIEQFYQSSEKKFCRLYLVRYIKYFKSRMFGDKK